MSVSSPVTIRRFETNKRGNRFRVSVSDWLSGSVQIINTPVGTGGTFVLTLKRGNDPLYPEDFPDGPITLGPFVSTPSLMSDVLDLDTFDWLFGELTTLEGSDEFIMIVVSRRGDADRVVFPAVELLP